MVPLYSCLSSGKRLINCPFRLGQMTLMVMFHGNTCSVLYYVFKFFISGNDWMELMVLINPNWC